MHLEIHRDITKLVKENKQKFNPFIVGPVPIDTHINMSKLGTWGTQVELIPASTIFQVLICKTAFPITGENTPQF